MKTHIKSIGAGLACISFLLLPVACKKAEEKSSAAASDATPDEAIVDWEFEELTTTELRAVPLSESFARARKAFDSGDNATAIEQIKLVAGFFAREAETRSGKNKEAFGEYGRELSNLASLLETEGEVAEKDLDEIFANAHLILALDRASSAQAAASENKPGDVGENMRAAVDHARQALRQVGEQASTEMSKAGDAIEHSVGAIESGAESAKEKTISAANSTRDYTLGVTRQVGEKIKEGKESTTRKTKEATGKLIERIGKAVEKMGHRMEAKGSEIQVEPTEGEGNGSDQ
jgi:predicted  nucleic acid-binding Zn-ribbon protein